MPTLYPPQIPAVEQTLALLRQRRRPILSLPTGGGKSVCAVAVVESFLAENPGATVLFLAHLRELVLQLAAHLERAGLRVGIIKAGFPSVPSLPVQVASVQTLCRRELPPADLLVWDEAHHLLAKSFRRVSDAYPNAVQLGLTATPWRLDGKGLGQVFTDIVATPETRPHVLTRTINPATGRTYLVEPKVFAPPAPSLRGVHRIAGDYNRQELARAVDKPKLIADAVATWLKYAKGVPSIYFAVNVEHSRHIVEQFRAAGVRADHCDADTPDEERTGLLQRLGTGDIDLLSNVGLFGEGVDVPVIKCVGLCRPTESMGMYYQMTGRAMRSTPDGGPAIVLDHAGLVHKFGRVTQELEYSLDGAPQTDAPKVPGHGLKTCPNCFRMVLRSRTACPECGHSLTTETEIPEFEAGELVAMDSGMLPGAVGPGEKPRAPQRRDDEEEAWRYLEETRLESGRAAGWSVAEFRRRFGRSPAVVTVQGMRVLATRNASEAVRDAAWTAFKAEAAARGKVGRDMHAYAAAMCVKLFGSVPAAAKQRARLRATSARAERNAAKEKEEVKA
jgi:DNA repair protein RadD